MRSLCVMTLLVPAAVITAACSTTTTSEWGSASTGQSDQSADQSALAGITQYPSVPVCERVRPGSGAMRCHATTRANPDGTVQTSATPSGFGPTDLRSAYNLPASGGNSRIVAVVDAYDDPTAESDLAVYRSQFGLSACTSANGCFTKVSQTGSTTELPTANSGWSGEISLDVDMVSAACPDCKILLVEASSADDADLGAAVNEAAALGAAAISNSYGGGEDSGTSSESTEYYDHPGVLVTASAGDQAFGAEFPATSQYVLAVGGTSLAKSSSTRGWAESAWSDGGSGCSAYIAKPSWQTQTVCSNRMEADVSAVADPDTGVAVYQSGAWQVYGGTSVASPLVAAIFTLLDLNGQTPQFAWTHTSDFYDVTSGKNGSCGTIECTAGVGYDGPTGWGTPNGAALAGSTSSSSSSGSGTSSTSSGSSTSSTSSGSSTSSSGSSTSSGSTSSSGSSTSSGSNSSSSGSTSSSGSSTSSSGSSSSGSSSGSTSSSGSSSSGGGGTCSHAVCSSGVPLTSTCSTCAGDVCAKDPYCCQTQWDAICVSEVPQDCPGTTCTVGGGGGGTCGHAVCKSGAALGSSCSTCAGDVCAQDPYCCSVAWDKICVSEVNEDCSGQTCP
jgi:hypothetical protein